MSKSEAEQLNLADYFKEVEKANRLSKKRQGRRDARGFIVFATDPDRVGEDDYKLVFACEARTRADAESRVRPLVGQHRRVAAYLASGKYRDQLSEARWVASDQSRSSHSLKPR